MEQDNGRGPEERPLELILARNLISIISLAAILVDVDGDIVFFNDAAGELIGRSYLDIGQLPVSRWQELFEPRTLDEEPLKVEQTPSGIALLERKPVHDSFAFRGLDGREHDITVTAFPLFSRPDAVVGVMSIFWELPAAP